MKSALPKLVALIGWITVVSGAVQMAMPTLILGPLHGETTATSAHFFRIVGMFMALFGGLLLHAYRRPAAFIPVFWCGLQKVGAVGAVSLAVAMQLLSPLALGVAGFDLLSAVLIFVYARGLPR